MKKLKFVTAAKILLFVVLATSAVSVIAQSPPDPPNPGDDPVPISGIEILLLAGGALGGYKLFQKKSSDKNTP